jgi:tetratricopeptide (TPR) repeat protein
MRYFSKIFFQFIFPVSIFIFFSFGIHGQLSITKKELRAELNKATEDTTRINILFELGKQFIDGPSDSLLSYYGQARQIIQARLKASDEDIDKLNKDEYRMYKNFELRTFIEFGIEYFFRSEYQKALEYYFQALTIAGKYADIGYVSECYSEIGIVYKNQGKYDLALDYYHQALELAAQTGNNSWIATCNTNIGNVYKEKGYFIVALDYYLKALGTFEKLGHTRRMAACYENIGEVYHQQKDHEQALYYFNNALKLARESAFKSMITTCNLNIGKVYTNLGIYDYARSHFDQSLEVLKTQGYTHELDNCYKGIGHTCFMEKEFVKAIEYYQMALEISERENDKASIAETLGSLGNIFIQTGDYNKAQEYLNRSLAIAKEIGSLKTVMTAYSGLSKIYEKRGELLKSITCYQLYDQVKDSLFNVEKYKAITEMAVKYESEKKEQELELLTEKHQVEVFKVSRRNRLIIGIAILFFLIILIVYLLFRHKELKSKHKSAELEQKFLRTQMNPHFIFNSLIAIQSYIYKKEPVIAGDYLAKFADLVRMILENSRVEFVVFGNEIKTLEIYLQLQSLRFENLFDYRIEVDEHIETDSLKVPPMFAQPFIENAIEHGLRHKGQKGLLSVRYVKTDNYIICTVEDNGVGREKAREFKKKKRHKSLATAITKERLQVLSKKYNKQYSLEVIDLKDGEIAHGTLVKLMIPFVE